MIGEGNALDVVHLDINGYLLMIFIIVSLGQKNTDAVLKTSSVKLEGSEFDHTYITRSLRSAAYWLLM